MTGRMADKVVIITGGGTGIGRASAERLAEEGAHVIVCGRRREPLDDTTKAIGVAGGSAEAVVLDVSDLDALAKTIAEIASRHGRLDGLVNNAMSVTYKTILDATIEDWRADFAVNADAVFVGTREAMRVMIPQKRGSIVNISSLNAMRAMVGMASYSASKAALIQFSAVAAIEGAPHGVRVNAIAPGMVMTPALQDFAKADPERAARSASAIPMGRGGQPRELANAVLYLLSDESTFTTGVCLNVDGGKSAQLYIPE